MPDGVIFARPAVMFYILRSLKNGASRGKLYEFIARNQAGEADRSCGESEKMSKQLFMFDLDGTLINSVGGIANSVNVTRQQYGFPPLPVPTITGFTGDGAVKLLERSFADVTLPVPVPEAVAAMVKNYENDPVRDTYLYDGVAETLRTMKEKGVLLAVVSNKPESVGTRILAELGVADLFCENIGGGRFPLKPAPDAFLHVMGKYGAAPEDCWIVGDNHTDIHASSAIPVRSVFCRYGFGVLADAAPTVEIDAFAELLHLLRA